MNTLKAMKTFVRVAETGNLSAAARHLGMTQPAVSQQILALEQRLGVVLLFRTTRSVSLTEPGERYYQQITPILAALAETEENLAELKQELKGPLRIQAPTGLGQQLIAPVVIAFKQAHPGLSVELLLEDRLADMTSEGIDLAVRLGQPSSPGLVVRRLATVDRVLVASPDYLQRRGTPSSLSGLASHAIVRYSALQEGNTLTLKGPAGMESVRLNTAFRANNSFTLIAALAAGSGIGGVQQPLVNEYLHDGRLVRILPHYHWEALPLQAVYPAGRFIPLKTRMLVDAIIAAITNIGGITPLNNSESR